MSIKTCSNQHKAIPQGNQLATFYLMVSSVCAMPMAMARKQPTQPSRIQPGTSSVDFNLPVRLKGNNIARLSEASRVAPIPFDGYVKKVAGLCSCREAPYILHVSST